MSKVPSLIFSNLTKRSGGWLFVGVAIHLCILWLALGWTLRAKPAHAEWGAKTWVVQNPGVIPAPALFDSYVLLFGAEIRAEGKNPLSPEFLNKDGVFYNYPSGWSFLGLFGFTRQHWFPFSWGLALLFCASLWLLMPPVSMGVCLAHAAVLFSPPGLNALGQANGELLVVSLLAVAASLALGSTRIREVFASVLLFAAALLKLYPAIGFGILALRGRKWRWVPVLFFLVLIVCLLCQRAEIAEVIARTPKPFSQSFGCLLIPLRVENLLRSGSHWLDTFPALGRCAGILASSSGLFRLGFLLLAACGFVLGARVSLPGRDKQTVTASDFLIAFGAVLFVGTFGIGSSWTHRELTLVLCLAGCMANGKRPLITLLVLATLWSPVLTSGPSFALEQVIMWTCVFVLSREIGRYCLLNGLPGMLGRCLGYERKGISGD